MGREVVRSLAEVFVDYGHGYIWPGLLARSPGRVALFLGDWLPRKTFLDDAQREVLPEVLRRWVRFALGRRGVDAEWIEPVVAAVDIYLPDFLTAVDDESAWGPAKQIAAELTARGGDLTDKAAVDAVIGEMNAAARARDVDDLRTLAALAVVATVDDAVRLCGDFYPDEVISPRAMGVIRELFE